jgi:hypothetical protein
MKKINRMNWFVRCSAVLTLLLGSWLTAPPAPAVSSSLEVTSAADRGAGTLRQALLDAQSGDTITFRAATFPTSAPTTIYVLSVLPTISQNNLTLDASSAGVILDGSGAPGGTNGLIISGDNNNIYGLTIRNFSSNGIILEAGASSNKIGGDRTIGVGPNGRGCLIIANGGSGIELRGTGTDSNYIQGNYIGIDASGKVDSGNTYNGVAIWQGAKGNTVGGINPGFHNVISGNEQNGVWIGGNGADQNVVIGNYLGTTSDGMAPVGNGFSGVSLQSGAQNNWIGGTAAGEGNLISGNHDHGIYLSDPNTRFNRILGNKIGSNLSGNAAIGQGWNGIVITLGASQNIIGDGSSGGRNLISGNPQDGIRVEGSTTISNTIQGNYIGTNLNGTSALPNGLHGVELADYTHGNLLGGNRLVGQGNLLSGNRNHGVVVGSYAHHNTVAGNLVGPDVSGSYSLGGHPFGGIDIAEGAHDNTIGGLIPGWGNLVSGNQTDGIALFDNTGSGTWNNQIAGNTIGLTLDGSGLLPNRGDGIFNVLGAYNTRIEQNTIAGNTGYGVWTVECIGNTITQNSIYTNTLGGIRNLCQAAPQVTAVSTDTLTGRAAPNARVEFFSDDGDQGRYYEGFTTANTSGDFTYTHPGGFKGPNIMATSTNSGGTTSAFSKPVHLAWTVLLYLNGDNDLEDVMQDMLYNLANAGPSPRANVLALFDGYQSQSETVLYDLTSGQLTPVTTTLGLTHTLPGELDLGDGQTLVDFVNWGRQQYPSEYTLLSIVDHGGGWAPSPTEVFTNTLPIRRRVYLAGNSGLSWDFTDDYDYLDSPEIRQSLAAITSSGARPLDVLYYDVCLMGMIEVAYQIKDYASFFVSSQNIAWAPIGPDGRYVRTIQGITPGLTPRGMAQLLVNSYADSLPPEEHPFTISAIDLQKLPALAASVNQFGEALQATLPLPAGPDSLEQTYLDAQKIDYDTDFYLEASSDGFVDLYDLAQRAAASYTDQNVFSTANAVISAFNTALVDERHHSSHPWFAPNREWNLDNTHGLSIFLPLGEDLELPIGETSPITPGLTITHNLHLRDTYSSNQLLFLQDTSWGGLIDDYYQVIASPVPTDTTLGPASGLLIPDITPPQTVISLTGTYLPGQTVKVAWSSSDAQTGLAGASLWHKAYNDSWTNTGLYQSGDSGNFSIKLTRPCWNGLAVRAVDKAGNLEKISAGANAVFFMVPTCINLPLISR